MQSRVTSPFLVYDSYNYSKAYKRTVADSGVSGWFFIRVASLLNYSEMENLKNVYNIHLQPHNMVANGWFHHYLNDSQQYYLINSEKFDIFKQIRSPQKTISSNAENTKYLIHAIPNWTPRDISLKSRQISENFYVVDHVLSIESLDNDERVASYRLLPNREALNRYEIPLLLNGETTEPELHAVPLGGRKLYKMGLDGTGQIINIVDTGIDEFNCFFYDKLHRAPINTTNLEHRKIVRIDDWIDSQDAREGHGSHVAGSAAGAAVCEGCGMSVYNGAAPGAKIYMTDIGKAEIRDDVSGDYDLELTSQRMTEMGAGISSNSWGYSEDPGIVEFMFDSIAEKYPYITFIFATGNAKRPISITAPATGKNTLGIGLTTNAASYKFESSSGNNLYLESADGKTVKLNQSTYTDYFSSTLKNESAWLSNVPIVDYNHESEFHGKIVKLTDASNIADAFEYGARAVIVVNSPLVTDIDKSPVFSTTSDFDFTAGSIILRATQDAQIDHSFVQSQGPSVNGLLKPDISAPGHPLISACSGGKTNVPGSCDRSALTSKRGTSMATPLVSGLAAIVRQYMQEGWYKSNAKNSGVGYTPSSALMRALLINSAVPMISSKRTPDNLRGFGYPVLTNLIESKLLFADNLTIGSFEHHKTTFKVNGKCRLSVTMSYIDATMQKYVAPLFADLDIYLIHQNGKVYTGNQFESGSTEQFSTNERVLLTEDEVTPGTYELHILSNEYSLEKNIFFAIAITGDVDNTNPILQVSKENSCISGCGSHGTCSSSGICVCKDGYYGYNCGLKAKVLNEAETITLPEREPTILYFDPIGVMRRLYTVSLKDSSASVRFIVCHSQDVYKGVASADECTIITGKNETLNARNYIYIYPISQNAVTATVGATLPLKWIIVLKVLPIFLIVVLLAVFAIIAMWVIKQRRKKKGKTEKSEATDHSLDQKVLGGDQQVEI